MNPRALALLAAPALALAASPAAAQNWNATFAETPAQGHRVGDPEAPLQIIEYVSYTCPHCAHFEQESEAQLRYFYVHEGHAAVEVRHLIRNVIDVAAALVTECGEEDRFFDNHRTMLHRQDDWLAKAQALSPAQQARWQGGSVSSRMRAIASDLDFYEMMDGRGLSRSEIDQCLSNEARARQIAEQSGVNAAEYGVRGTPSFVLEGTLLEGVHSWPQLNAVLAAAREMPETVLE